ncbi:DNA-binding SARP family transcriptional activator [Nocardiopsis sp. Huas11]|uniref:AfsR/SARP family transcriptional regulator n=1 Tax=Nocardiopsis sp. Huas11 TaxID=2183912 RepID=UPI000F1698DF|nr:BTAD domain-containing putative transcriptional regulator [Nocardiopsis sp. Huas11]RKS10401.1 DNA-binding SARP family transcriptional activator [Nocardiopsis sp. Huas11]
MSLSASARRDPRGLYVGLLGQFVVEVDGVPLRLRGDKRRTVLATLLLRAGQTVPADHLIARVWGTPAGQVNRSALQVHVARARAIFDDHCGRPLIHGGDGGYRVDLEEGESDLLAFRALAAAAGEADSRDDPARHTDLLLRALRLWRSPVLADVASPVLHERDVAPLNEELLRVAEAGCSAALARGEHARAAEHIGPIVADHPERESLIRLQMIALHRAGRPSEALRLYARTRDVLAERLGADPGRELQETFHAILRGDLDRAARVPRQRAEPVLAAAPRSAAPAPQSCATPAELPAAPAVLVGRGAHLAELDRLADPAGPAPGNVLVRGPAGAGSSALALGWAHSVAAHFPDGQVYVNLRRDDGTPREPAEVLRRLVRSLSGGRDDTGDLSVDESAARARSLLARRRVLMVLDNAASTRQVRPLLPGCPECAAVVTSRYWLTDLLVRDGVRALPVGALTAAEAVVLLRSLLGEERCTDAALHRVAQLAGHLPLALRMAVAWLDTHPARSGSDLVRRLEAVDPARCGTPTARMAAVLHAGPEEARHGRGEVPTGHVPPDPSLGDGSFVRLSPG